jgi:hypothetical protein
MLLKRLRRFPEGKIRSNIPRETMGAKKKGRVNAMPNGTWFTLPVAMAKQMAGKNSQTNVVRGNARIQRKMFIVSLAPR